jgi:hypothetical protein
VFLHGAVVVGVRQGTGTGTVMLPVGGRSNSTSTGASLVQIDAYGSAVWLVVTGGEQIPFVPQAAGRAPNTAKRAE